jgi:hypothetical protein
MLSPCATELDVPLPGLFPPNPDKSKLGLGVGDLVGITGATVALLSRFSAPVSRAVPHGSSSSKQVIIEGQSLSVPSGQRVAVAQLSRTSSGLKPQYLRKLTVSEPRRVGVAVPLSVGDAAGVASEVVVSQAIPVKHFHP